MNGQEQALELVVSCRVTRRLQNFKDGENLRDHQQFASTFQ